MSPLGLPPPMAIREIQGVDTFASAKIEQVRKEQDQLNRAVQNIVAQRAQETIPQFRSVTNFKIEGIDSNIDDTTSITPSENHMAKSETSITAISIDSSEKVGSHFVEEIHPTAGN